jgi:hypothetical protein
MQNKKLNQMDNQDNNLRLTEQQHIDLVDVIYEWIMDNEEMGLGEMADARDEAERIVRRWTIRTNSSNFKNQLS